VRTLLWRSQLRFVLHAPWSALSSLLGIALGVASVIAVHQIGVAIEASVAAGRPPHLGGLTHVLERPGLQAVDYFALRDRWRAAESAGATQVRRLVPVLEAPLPPLRHGADAVPAARLFASDWLQASPTAARTSLQPGEVLEGAAVIADRSLGLDVGDRLTPAATQEPVLTVAGVVDSGLGGVLFMDLSTAHRLLELPADALSYIGVTLADPWARWRRLLDGLLPGFSAGLPDAGDVDALSRGLLDEADRWRLLSVRSQQPSLAFSRSVLFNLGALGTLALVVSWFLVHQVAVIWLRRQQPVYDRLEMLGVARRRLLAQFVVLLAAVGALATVLGVVLGLPLADALLALTAAGAADGGSAATVPAPGPLALLKAVASGVGVAMVGALMAVLASRRPSSRILSPLRLLLLAALLLVVLTGSAWSGSGLLGGFLAVLALCFLVTLCVRPLLDLLRERLARIRGPLLWRLSCRQLLWQPADLAVALGALALAVAASLGVGLMVASFRIDFARMLDERLAADVYLRGPPARVAAAARSPGVQALTVVLAGSSRVRVAGLPAVLDVFDAPAADGRRQEAARFGLAEPLAGREVLINERLARALGVAAGDTLTLGDTTLQVRGLFPGYGDSEPRLRLPSTLAETLGLPVAFDRLSLTGAGSRALADTLVRRHPDLTLVPQGEVRERALAVFDATFAITRALTVLALLVALVGLANALTAQKLGHGPALALLESLGVTVAERRRLSLYRSLVVGGLATGLALPLGLAMAWLLCTVINPRAFGWSVDLHLDAAALGGPLLLGWLVAALAGLAPLPRERLRAGG